MMLCLAGFLLPKCQQAATVCALGFKGRNSARWGSCSLFSTSFFTSVMGVMLLGGGPSASPGTWVGSKRWAWLPGAYLGLGSGSWVGFGEGPECCLQWSRCVGKARGFGSGAQSALPCLYFIHIAPGDSWGKSVPTIWAPSLSFG